MHTITTSFWTIFNASASIKCIRIERTCTRGQVTYTTCRHRWRMCVLCSYSIYVAHDIFEYSRHIFQARVFYRRVTGIYDWICYTMLKCKNRLFIALWLVHCLKCEVTWLCVINLWEMINCDADNASIITYLCTDGSFVTVCIYNTSHVGGWWTGQLANGQCVVNEARLTLTSGKF